MSSSRRIALKLDLKWPYKRHTGIFAGAQIYAKAHGWATIIDEFIDESARYDGVIARTTRPLAGRLKSNKMPIVNVWLNSPSLKVLPGVFPDYAASGRLRAEHLLNRGFRNFAAMVERGVAARMEGKAFRRVLRDAGGPCVAIEIASDISKTHEAWEKAEKAISDWMDQWVLPIGVHITGDFMGRIIAQKCIERGWRVPDDVGIIAGWNEEAICEQPQPSLSSVDLGYEQVGYKAAKLLDQLMNEKQGKKGREPVVEPRHVFTLPQGLIVRESTDFYSVEDRLVASALSFISANSHLDIGQDDVARAVLTETRTLQSRFRKVLDRPIAAVIRQVRIDRATRELTQSSRSMSVIASDAGFSSAERMNEVFRRELGISPSQYRKQRQMGGQP